MFAPVVVFSYNRPNHLKQTLEALSKNEWATESDLFIFCDGAKENASEEQLKAIAHNRAIAHDARGFKTVHVIEREKNLGLANSIISGVTSVIDDYGRAIVLEDDLLSSPYFLRYMNLALEFYHDRPGVMSISANRPPRDKMEIPEDYEYDVFVCLRSYSTGWATWKEKWDKVDWSLDYLEDFLDHPYQIEAFNRAGDDMTKMLKLQKKGMIDSWAIRFGFAHFREHAVAILPCVSYVDNIGFDGTGIHSGTINTGEYRNDLSLCVRNPRFVDLIYEDSRIINAFYNRFTNRRRPIWQKAINFIYRKLHRKPPFVIKKKVFV